MQQAEKYLSEKTSSAANPLVSQMLKELDKAVVYNNTNNITTNQKLWDNYSREWNVSNNKQDINDWVLKMASNVGMNSDIQALGDEWAPRSHTLEIINEFIYPYINDSSIVAEIGVGGGRIAKEVVNRVSALHCYDVSSEMIARSKKVVVPDSTRNSSIHFTLLNSDNQSLQCSEGFFDFIYSFDVLPHVDLHVIFSYLKEINRVLKPGGKCFISTADLSSQGGWERFEVQTISTVGGFCFTTPDAVLLLIKKAGLKVVKIGERTESNVYLHRDFLVVVEKES